MRRRSTTLLATALLLCAIDLSTAFPQQPAELIHGIVSRSQAIASGRISYTFKSESRRGGRASKSTVLPEVTTSFSDSSWADRTKGSQVVRINHDGYFLEFVQTPQRDGSRRPGATLLPQKALGSRMELNAPPVFAGSFWHPEQLQYVEKHADDFQLVRSSVINEIPVVILQLDVRAELHRDAFHILLPALKSGGIIRLYVAPQLGFVLPRIEFLTPSNQVAMSCDAVDFNEVAPGIYFPKRLWTETHAAGGASPYRGEFTTRCELINQTIPPEDFIVELPLGTRIQDAQEPGRVITFNLTEALSSAKLQVHGSGSSGSQFGFLGRWRNAMLVGIVIGAVASISFYLAGKNQPYRGRSTKSTTNGSGQTRTVVADGLACGDRGVPPQPTSLRSHRGYPDDGSHPPRKIS